MKIIPIVSLLLSSFVLSGCGTLNSSFDCPNQAGISCKSLDQINSMVDSGEIQGRSSVRFKNNLQNTAEFTGYQDKTVYSHGAPVRSSETVQRIWVAPYEDAEGTYHLDSMMFALVKRGAWVSSSLKSVKTI